MAGDGGDYRRGLAGCIHAAGAAQHRVLAVFAQQRDVDRVGRPRQRTRIDRAAARTRSDEYPRRAEDGETGDDSDLIAIASHHWTRSQYGRSPKRLTSS